MMIVRFFVTVAFCIFTWQGFATAGTLEDVRERGMLHCGISGDLIGFSSKNAVGEWSGIDVDFCRAVAAAVLGSTDKIKFFPSSAQDRFDGLQDGTVDIVSHNATWTLTRDTSLNVQFVGVTYYDGQGVMVPRTLNITSVTELDGGTVCTDEGTTTVQNIKDYFNSKNMRLDLVSFENISEVFAAYDAGQCDAYTTDKSALASQRRKLEAPSQHVILPEVISKEPLGPYVRAGDQRWFNIVRWTLMALIEAEEIGIASINIDERRVSDNPTIRRFVGIESKLGQKLGLSNDWAYNIIKQVGNYGEIFYRNLGPKTSVHLERGMNALWTQGGLMYAPPIR